MKGQLLIITENILLIFPLKHCGNTATWCGMLLDGMLICMQALFTE
jgi:hypothetical protein